MSYPAAPPPSQPYPAQPAPGPGVPQQYGNGAHPGYPQYPVPPVAGPACRFCGCVPAINLTLHGHQGFVVIMRFLSLKGPFCRDCGLAAFRRMTASTLVQGWYGLASFIIAPLTVLMNLIHRSRIGALAPPQPNPYGPSSRPEDPGPALFARPSAIIGLAIPFAIISGFVILSVLNR